MSLIRVIKTLFAFIRHYPNARIITIYTIKYLNPVGMGAKLYTTNCEYVKGLKHRKDVKITKEYFCRSKY